MLETWLLIIFIQVPYSSNLTQIQTISESHCKYVEKQVVDAFKDRRITTACIKVF